MALLGHMQVSGPPVGSSTPSSRTVQEPEPWGKRCSCSWIRLYLPLKPHLQPAPCTRASPWCVGVTAARALMGMETGMSKMGKC